MWNDHAVKLTIKAIGEVESNLTYDAINFADPITVGVAQWYGVRAAGLLRRIAAVDRPRWSNVDASLRGDIDSRSPSSNYWNSRYLTRSEGASLKPLLLHNKDTQNLQFSEDIDDYVQVMANVGFRYNDATQAAIFFCTMYHQAPTAALQVLQVVGLNPSLDQIYRAALNHAVLGQYRSRQDRVRAIILADDISGVDDLPEGDSDDAPEGGGDPSPPTASSNLRYLSVEGDAIHLHRRDGSTVVAVPSTTGRYTFTRDASVGAPGTARPGEPGGGTGNPRPGAPGGTQAQQELVQWMLDREGKFGYSQGPQRNDPDRTGVADCSSVVRQAYKDVMGIDIGYYTGDQWTNGRRIQSGRKGQYPNPSLLQPGDLMYSLTGWSGRSTVDHVDMIIDGEWLIGHTGNPPMGPVRRRIREFLDWPKTTNWYVQRHV
jgi:cell wall-associated NlpC family hydrolase